MPVQHSPPARRTRSQDRAQAVVTPTTGAPLDDAPAVPQPRAHLDRGPNFLEDAPSWMEGRGKKRSSSFSGVVGGFPGLSRTTFKIPGEDGEEEEENSVEKEESNGTESVPALVGHPKVLEGQLYPSLISLPLINLNHLYWPLCRK
ncbi:hypothetical protein O181_060206 [Austropuccinia psidii MF-1]|uniref:Uncharacterized protein n=1 Tax=Austropuccinia psidii MF-1 TaxID=1389203 RepID=A0A9Q3EKH4_9BASI|nr:hypothetical protein [Austropuccinia psidii MF-1]